VRHISNYGHHVDLFDICQCLWQDRIRAQDTAGRRHVRARVLRAGCGRTSGRQPALGIALRLKALADPARVKLVSLLFSSAVGEMCSCDLAEAVGLTESTVSHHLTQLRRAGMVESERRGMNVYHRPRRDALVALCSVLDPSCCA
jgi:ArsR family transcriptional regulator